MLNLRKNEFIYLKNRSQEIDTQKYSDFGINWIAESYLMNSEPKNPKILRWTKPQDLLTVP